MFRWCSYCQHLMGEQLPLDDFRLTHGICERCEATLDDVSPPPPNLGAERLLRELEAASRSGAFELAAQTIRRALDSGIRGSEILIGVLSPALCAVGKQWECGELTVAEEHRFTAFSSSVIDQIGGIAPAIEPPAVVLVPMSGNTHELGVRMLQLLAWERGIAVRRLPVGLTPEEIVAAGRQLQPRHFGISVSLEESIPQSFELGNRLLEVLPASSSLALGGGAFRRREVRSPQSGLRVLRTMDEYLDWVEPVGLKLAAPAMGLT